MGPDNFYPSTSDNAGLRRQKVCYEHSRSAGVCNNSCHSLDTKITEPRVQTRLCLAEAVGFEPTDELPRHRISSAARYDHFGTLPRERYCTIHGVNLQAIEPNTPSTRRNRKHPRGRGCFFGVATGAANEAHAPRR